MPEQVENCNYCGADHPAVERNTTFTEPGREGLLTLRGHVPCPTCNGYHTASEDHKPCDTCGQVHSDTRDSIPATNGDFVDNHEHGPLRYCEGCADYVDQEHADNWEDRHYASDAADEGWHDSRYPRTEDELVHAVPERVAGIRERIDKLVKLHDMRVADSQYFIKHSPAGTYYGQYGHNVQVYHKRDPNTRVGMLTYDDDGIVGSMYIDHRHQGTMAATQMLVAAHRHLKNTIGNPIGLLRTESTSEQSGALIRKIDPESTYLRHDSADSGRNTNWVDQQHLINNTPLRNDSLQLTKDEWQKKSDASGRSVADLMAMSYEPRARYTASEAGRVSDEAKLIGNKINKFQEDEQAEDEKTKKRVVGTAAANLIAQGVHEVPGDMPAHDWLDNAWMPSARDRVAALRAPKVLQETQPHEVASELSFETLKYLGMRAREATPQSATNRKTETYKYGNSKPDPEDIKASVEAWHGRPAPDLIGTSGVWTGDEETDEKATLPAPKPGLPLDLNPYERVKRVTDPMGRRSYVQGD